jgi:hypothetical protein
MDNKGILHNGSKCSRIILALLTLVPSAASAMDSGYVPPIAFYVQEQFATSGGLPVEPRYWESVGGSWQAVAGTYDSTVAAPTAVSTIFEYFINPFDESEPTPRNSFTLRARVLNQGAAATQLAGIVFNYQDAANYDEVVLSPTGTMLLRRVSGGAATTLRTSSLAAGAQNIWFELELLVDQNLLTIKVNGVTRIDRLARTNTTGRVGLVTHNTTAKFDYIFVGSPFSEQPFTENFSSGLNPWWADGPPWNVSGGTLNNTVTEATSRTAGFGGRFFAAESTLAYTVWARMYNPYGASGNLVGLFFNNDGVGFPGAHGELVLSPTGVARLDLFYDGARRTIATAPYNGGPREWFDVRLDNTGGSLFVWVDGALVFDDIDVSPVQDGSVGLLTHWSPGKFDDVWYDNTHHPVLSAKFSEPLMESWSTSGAWNTSGSTLNSTAVGASDLALYNCSCWSTDSLIRARLLNQYGASGNLVGVVYNYVDAGVSPDQPDYYEVVFSSTGIARINKVLNGVRTLVASGSHNVPRNVWFDVEILRRGTTTTVKVNGTTIFNNVQQGELGAGKVGVVTHWSKGRFDNVVVRDNPLR